MFGGVDEHQMFRVMGVPEVREMNAGFLSLTPTFFIGCDLIGWHPRQALAAQQIGMLLEGLDDVQQPMPEIGVVGEEPFA